MVYCSKELRDIFEDIVEKIVLPLKSQLWSADDVQEVLDAVVATFGLRAFPDSEQHTRYTSVFSRFFTAIANTVVILYK
jgi:hypothetical protein